jgi:hypothetical protein
MGMKSLLFLFVSVLAISASAKNKAHREHEAHEHGAATLAIAFDNSKGKVEFKGAAEGVLGFEHQVKTEKDKKTVADAVLKFEKGIAQMVAFDASLKCQFQKEMIGSVPEKGHAGSGEHSEWVANFTVACEKSPVGTTVKIDFSGIKGLHDVDVTVLAEGIQKSAEFKKAPVSIELK